MSRHKKKRTQISIRIFQLIIILLGLVILGRLFQLQILNYETYEPLSRQNALRQQNVNPARGLIYDRNGRLLVDNKPIYSITITPSAYDREKTPLLAQLLGIAEEEVEKRVEEARAYSWYRTSRLFTEIDFKTFSIIQENIWQLPGIGHQIESKRHYPVDSLKASHTLGYLREVSKEEYLQQQNYHLGDKIGKTGLEKQYEAQLKGQYGTEYILVNAMGQNLGSYQDGAIDEAPVKGANLNTTLDTDLQLLAEDLMEGKRGGLVALNPKTGGVLSMVSAPQYDIRRLSGRIDFDYWQKINQDPDNPLFSRALSSKQPPGSTFKPLMGLMGLELDIINPQTSIYNPGYYSRGRRYNDLADPGQYNLEKALQESSNTFFFWLMDKIVHSYSIDRWNELASTFGLGSNTGIDLPNETSGILPDSTYLNNLLGEGTWGIGDQISLGVGQGFLAASPLQMATVVSQIANGGYALQPHLVHSIKESDGTVLFPENDTTKISWIDRRELEIVKAGMRRVVTTGSGRYYANLDSVKVAGKTGTAQNPHGEDHGWFVCFAPMDDPQIAIAVLIENGGYGSISAAPIASLLVEQYVTGKINRTRVYDYVKDFEPESQNDDNE
ncbi:penicillin-binding protein 2 [Fodinibius sediminis]|uniref:Peptidoglycan glycosyltransferase n=1 Tax=Fodinibius sediminis TaxID=1214077 RepID=A0A521E0C5_9BACT|nr:penicillin-binding protein 2 [Fodinibius sediminis]SMO77404.1 peptidoglycan glycosyltransferase [Fodinibius sediminis]